jgi:hypothetical protein
MQFTDEQIISFQRLYKQEFGEDISHDEAFRQASSLVSLVKNYLQANDYNSIQRNY